VIKCCFAEGGEPLTSDRKLTWLDLILVMTGIAVSFLLIGVGTLFLSQLWQEEKHLIQLSSFMLQLAFVFILWIIHKRRGWSWRDFGWRRIRMRGIWPRIVMLFFLSLGVGILWAVVWYALKFTFPDPDDVYVLLFANNTWWMTVLTVFVISVVGPLCEETLFRGVIFAGLRGHLNRWLAIGISAVIFSGMHLDLYNFVPHFVFGVMLACLYERYQSLYPAVALHSLNNVAVVMIMLLTGSS
jgi:membrane protease YdiL (CAAX protease family)